MPLLESGKLDLIVGRLYELDNHHDVHRDTIYHEPISAMVRADHPLLQHSSLSVGDLSDFGIVLPSLEQRLGPEVDNVLTEAGLVLSSSLLRSTSISFIRELILSSDFVTVLPRLMMAGDIERGLVKIAPLTLTSGSRPAGIITLRHRRRTTAILALVSALRDYVGELKKTGLLKSE